MRDINDLRQRQSLPLGAKVLMTQARIREWYDHYDGNVCVSFSGGKDSTVLAHLVHDLYPEVPLVFCNTGLEYPEIQKFAKENGAEFVYPKMNFSEVISKYGYPIISKENAEAIHYARKICNGGVERKKESGMNLKAEDVTGLRIPPKIAGGGTGKRHTAAPTSQRFHIVVSRKNWMAKGNTFRKTARRITKTRDQFDRTGVVGRNGEDEPLPG